MCLLDAVEDWTADRIHCTARTHQAFDHPLRWQNRLSAVHLIEYAGQAIALHGALLAQDHAGQRENRGQTRPRLGMFGALRDVRFHANRIDLLVDPLSVVAHRRLARADGMVYDFTVGAGEQALCDGRAVIALGDMLGV